MNKKEVFSNGLYSKLCVIIWESLCAILEEKKKIIKKTQNNVSKRLVKVLILYQLIHGTDVNWFFGAGIKQDISFFLKYS